MGRHSTFATVMLLAMISGSAYITTRHLAADNVAPKDLGIGPIWTVALSPNAEHLAVLTLTSQPSETEASQRLFVSNLYVLDAYTLEVLHETTVDTPWFIRWSPDGSALITSGRGSTVVWNAQAEMLHDLGASSPETYNRRIAQPLWSSDGTRIAVAKYETDGEVDSAYIAIYDAATGVTLQVLDVPDESRKEVCSADDTAHLYIVDMDWSPDMRRLAGRTACDFFEWNTSTGELVAQVKAQFDWHLNKEQFFYRSDNVLLIWLMEWSDRNEPWQANVVDGSTGTTLYGFNEDIPGLLRVSTDRRSALAHYEVEGLGDVVRIDLFTGEIVHDYDLPGDGVGVVVEDTLAQRFQDSENDQYILQLIDIDTGAVLSRTTYEDVFGENLYHIYSPMSQYLYTYAVSGDYLLIEEVEILQD